MLIEVNEEFQNNQRQLCSTMFPVFNSLNLFRSSEPQNTEFLYANRKYRSSVFSFRVKWKLTLCRRQQIIFQSFGVVVEELRLCLYIIYFWFYRILL